MLKKLDIGGIKLENNLIMGPMAGISFMPFLVNIKKFGAGLLCSEMISSYGIVYNNQKTLDMLDVMSLEPISIQIFGNDASVMGESAKILEDMGVKILDINMGCPAPKVVNGGSGSVILKDLKLVKDIVKEVVRNVHIPVTVKIRAGWDLNNINAVEVSKIIEGEGGCMVTVHARTKTQKFNDFDWDIIRQVKANVKIPVIGNGNIFLPEDAKRMFEETGCDGFMLGRAPLSNPWIFRQILELDNKGRYCEITLEERFSYMLQFIEDYVLYRGEKPGVYEVRKFISWLSKGLLNASKLRNTFFSIENKEDLLLAVNNFKDERKRK